ncbi:MAG TPA: universal stress protein [Solirubrobacteraceae bacterium]|nr:universal stress protein [Solirubrobacteraceae bacterium]
MIKTVAVGTDGSETAGKAVSAALELAERYGASLVVLSAFNGGSGAAAAPRLSPSAHPEWTSNAAEQVERILAVAEESATERGIECSTAMAEGNAGEVLVDLADRHGADVLVVGSKGMERRVLGSVPNTVTHKASCSVLVVKTA